jgi:hypothetical protein
MSPTEEKAQETLSESASAVPTSTVAQQSDNVAHALAGAGGGLLSMALTYAPQSIAMMTTNNKQLPAHNALHTRPSRIEARPVVYTRCRATHHKARRRCRTLRRPGLCALRHQRYEFCILLLYYALLHLVDGVLTVHDQGTNGHAPSSKKPPSKPVVPPRNSQPSSPCLPAP